MACPRVGAVALDRFQPDTDSSDKPHPGPAFKAKSIRLDHAIEMFRVFGGDIGGDTPAGLPNARLAILPGTSHVSLVHRPELLLPVISTFLDTTRPKA
ncbi:hypothetical protein [Nocardia sp. NPDC046763]|uniref:alpha/beta fold hydrolase n=1 Tax=Nocardia sp. NPDC046763 TaxID=3155256 RepID=UPI0033EEFDF9